MKRRKVTYYLCIMMLVFSLSLNAQGNSNGKGKPPNPHKPPPPHPELPIDGGVSILLLIGAVFGTYKMYDKD